MNVITTKIVAWILASAAIHKGFNKILISNFPLCGIFHCCCQHQHMYCVKKSRRKILIIQKSIIQRLLNAKATVQKPRTLRNTFNLVSVSIDRFRRISIQRKGKRTDPHAAIWIVILQNEGFDDLQFFTTNLRKSISWWDGWRSLYVIDSKNPGNTTCKEIFRH